MSDWVRPLRRSWLWRPALACLILLTGVGPAAADEPSSSAANHFARGVELARQGNLEGAAMEFEAAHALSPHPAVLYNLGQTYASLGRPVDAVRTLQRYLADVVEASPARRKEVKDVIAFHEKRIGQLTIALAPADAVLSLDGKALAPQGSHASLAVSAGSHTVLVEKQGYRPIVLVPVVLPGQTTNLSVTLQPLEDPPQHWLDITCAVPDAATYLDGKLVGRTPWKTPLRVADGSHVLSFSRPGYEASPTTLDVREHVTVPCNLRRSPHLAKGSAARLSVSGAPPGSKIWVNGELQREQLLPAGRHVLVVESLGYQSWSQSVRLIGGRTAVVEVALTPTPATRKLLDERERTARRTYAYIGGGVGALLSGVAGILYAVNLHRYEDYAADADHLSRELSRRPASAAHLEQLGQLSDRAASIERMNYMALTAGFVGVALIGSSIALHVSAASLDSARRRASAIGVRGVTW